MRSKVGQKKGNIVYASMTKYNLWLICFILSVILLEVAVVFFVLQLGRIFDVALLPSGYEQYAVLRTFLRNFVVILAGVAIFRITTSLIEAEYRRRVFLYIKERFFRNTLAHEFSKFYQKGRSHFQTVLINEVKQVEGNFYAPLVGIIKNIIAIIVAAIFLAFYNIPILLFTLLISILPVLLPKIFEKRLEKRMQGFSAAMQEYTVKTNETLAGLATYKSYNAEQMAYNVQSKTNRAYAKAKIRAFFYMNFVQNIAIFSGHLVMVSVLLFAMVLSIFEYLTIGEMFAVFFISDGISSPMYALSENVSTLLSSKTFVKKFDVEEQSEYNGDLRKVSDKISIVNLSLYHENNEIPTLENFSTTFEIGKKYLIKGESGSGKSTLLKAMLGFFDDFKGSISYDSSPIESINICGLHNQIAYIPQDSSFFQATVRDNITLFDNTISDLDVISVMKTVKLDFDLDLNLEQGGKNFSGGELQRLALARAVLKGADILFLDEALSAVDKETAIYIETRLLSHSDYTVINVAHCVYEETVGLYDGIVEVGQAKS